MLDQNAKPTEEIDVRDVFGVDSDMTVPCFAERDSHVAVWLLLGVASTLGRMWFERVYTKRYAGRDAGASGSSSAETRVSDGSASSP